MSRARWLAPAAAIGVAVLGFAGRAAADIDSSNGCDGTGSFREGGFVVDARDVGSNVVEIPRSDTVDWQGSVTAPPGDYSGSISVDLPPPFGTVGIDSWSGSSQSTLNSGAKEYDLPSIVPAGVEFRVVGSHTDANGFCNGFVNLKIKGGAFDSPLAPVSLVGTVATGGGLFFVLRSMFRTVPKKVM